MTGEVKDYLQTKEVITNSLDVKTKAGFYGTTPIAQQTGVAISDAAIHAALVNLGLITA